MVKFVFAVYVLLGTLALLSAVAGIVMLFLVPPVGVGLLLMAILFALLTGSLRRSLKDLTRREV
ncbi:hypothetical protein [Microbacterium maritypicum]